MSAAGWLTLARNCAHVLVVTVLVAMLTINWSPGAFPMYDLDVYLQGARAVGNEGDLYELRVHGLPFTYPPFAAIVFVPLLLVPASALPLLVVVVVVAAFLASLFVLTYRVQLSARMAVFVLFAALAIEPLHRSATLGQVNTLLMLAIVVDLVLLPPRYRGVLIGLGAAIKLTPGVFVLLFVVRRDWASLLRAAASFMGALAAGWLAAPSASRYYWGGGLLELGRFGEGTLGRPDNQSLLGAFHSLPAALGSVKVWWALAALITVSAGVRILGRLHARADVLGQVCALAVVGLLISPISWTHHWVWLAAYLVWLARRQRWLEFSLVSAVLWSRITWWPTFMAGGTGWQSAVLQVASVAYVLIGVWTLLALWRSTRRAVGRECISVS